MHHGTVAEQSAWQGQAGIGSLALKLAATTPCNASPLVLHFWTGRVLTLIFDIPQEEGNAADHEQSAAADEDGLGQGLRTVAKEGAPTSSSAIVLRDSVLEGCFDLHYMGMWR